MTKQLSNIFFLNVELRFFKEVERKLPDTCIQRLMLRPSYYLTFESYLNVDLPIYISDVLYDHRLPYVIRNA